MKRKKLNEITTPQDRQEFLKYLLDKEVEKVRKIIYPYLRKNLMNDTITIEEAILEDNALGQYIWEEKSETHRILISKDSMDNYLKPKYKWIGKKYWKKDLINTIGHELVHALVFEKYEWMYKEIEGKHRDASPIFLATLQFLGYTSNHKCACRYKRSKMFKDVKKIIDDNYSYDDFFSVILNYMQNIEDYTREYNKENPFNSIKFNFSYYGVGLEKNMQFTFNNKILNKNDNKLMLTKSTSTTFAIGSIVDLDLIKNLVDKKVHNNVQAKWDSTHIACWAGRNQSDIREMFQKEIKNY